MPDRPAISDYPPAAAADGRPSSGGTLRDGIRTSWTVARRILTSRPVRWGFAAAAVAIGGYAVARQWAGVRAALASIGILTVAAAMISVLIAMLAAMQVWRLLLAALGSPCRPGSCSGALLAIGGFALAWSIGFVAVFAPAGAGVREVLLVALLSPVLGVGAATAVALVSRVLTTVGDLLAAGLAVGYVRGGAPPNHGAACGPTLGSAMWSRPGSTAPGYLRPGSCPTAGGLSWSGSGPGNSPRRSDTSQGSRRRTARRPAGA